MSDKKKQQLGMNPSTASNRLVKDVLWSLVQETGKDNCCKCGFPMSRETFTIEHIEPWLDSENPLELYFDLTNIAFSHHSCNVGTRRREKQVCGTCAAYNRGCRCSECKAAHAEAYRSNYTPEQRRARYDRTGN